MKRTIFSLPEGVASLVEREAQRRGISVSEVARRALIAYFGLNRSEPRQLPFAALGRSRHRHTARDLEEVLAAEWDRAGGR